MAACSSGRSARIEGWLDYRPGADRPADANLGSLIQDWRVDGSGSRTSCRSSRVAGPAPGYVLRGMTARDTFGAFGRIPAISKVNGRLRLMDAFSPGVIISKSRHLEHSDPRIVRRIASKRWILADWGSSGPGGGVTQPRLGIGWGMALQFRAIGERHNI